MKGNIVIGNEADDNQRNDELIVVTKPELPKVWDYHTSVKSMKGILHSWANLTEKMIKELSIARDVLSSQGKRTDIKTDVPKFPTWEEYCKDVGISKRQANRITNRYVAKKIADKVQVSLPEKCTQEEVKKPTPKEVGENKMEISCPCCKDEIYFICKEYEDGTHTHTLIEKDSE